MPIAVSQSDIEDHVISYFADRFTVDETTMNQATNLVTMFNFSPAAWATLADTLSGLDWMMALGAVIQPFEMSAAKTVADLTKLIWKHVPSIVPSQTAGASLMSLKAAAAKAGNQAAKKNPAKPPRV